jgi:hypothetical protein
MFANVMPMFANVISTPIAFNQVDVIYGKANKAERSRQQSGQKTCGINIDTAQDNV